MKDRLAVFATTSALCVLLVASPCSRAQQENQRRTDTTNQNPTAGQNRNQATGATETIHGVIAGITAQGEAMLDYRTNRAVAAEAAYLTVVGSPVNTEGAEKTRTTTGANEERGATNRKRHNVYYVWITPRTKVCEDNAQGEKTGAAGEAGRAGERGERTARAGETGRAGQGAERTTRAGEAAQSGQNRELALDNLEVGDKVEIKFTKNEESGANSSVLQTDQMRKKHGRHRACEGWASEIKILSDAAWHEGQGHGERSDKSRTSQ